MSQCHVIINQIEHAFIYEHIIIKSISIISNDHISKSKEQFNIKECQQYRTHQCQTIPTIAKQFKHNHNIKQTPHQTLPRFAQHKLELQHHFSHLWIDKIVSGTLPKKVKYIQRMMS